jgi:hypothetical protein
MLCSNCGALAVGDTCKYCGNEFKNDEPPSHSITVELLPSYCGCGNEAKFRCQICRKKPLCTTCDVMASRWSGTYQEYGFLIARGSDLPFGPVLYKEDIVPLLKGRRRNLYHLCHKCLKTGAPAAFDAIASGSQCEYPNCGSPTRMRCTCCRSRFCPSHIVSPKGIEGQDLPPWRPPDPATSRQVVSLRAAHSPDIKRDYRVNVIGLCVMCAIERTHATRRKIHGRAKSHSVIFQEKLGAYLTRPEILFRVSSELENWRASTIIKFFDRMVEKVLREIEENPEPCRRDRYLGSLSSTDLEARFTSRFVDDRGGDSRKS